MVQESENTPAESLIPEPFEPLSPPPPLPVSPPPIRPSRRWSRVVWREWVRPFIIILAVMGSFRSAVADWNHVPTGSMKPTILIGDRIFVNKLAYDLKVPFTRIRLAEWSAPRRGDLVVFFSPADGKRLVKRVIGLPGDRITMRNNRLQVNSEEADYEPLAPEIIAELEHDDQRAHRFATETIAGGITHPVMTAIFHPSKDTISPTIVPDGQFFVMGDNRDESFDSRWFGFVEQDLIIGRAVGVAISVDPSHFYLPRWHRFFTALP